MHDRAYWYVERMYERGGTAVHGSYGEILSVEKKVWLPGDDDDGTKISEYTYPYLRYALIQESYERGMW